MARNQNVYTARLDSGVYMAAITNFKQSATDATNKAIQRAYAVFVQNTTSQCRAFQLTVPAFVVSRLMPSVPPANVLVVEAESESVPVPPI